MTDEADPRVFFASERTLLAWLRTGLAIVGIGFVIAKFGLLIQVENSNRPRNSRPIVSTSIGVSFVLLGAVAVAGATWQHARFTGQLRGGQRPSQYARSFAVWISAAVAAASIALAVYLAVA